MALCPAPSGKGVSGSYPRAKVYVGPGRRRNEAVRGFLKARFQEVEPDLQKARGNGLLVLTCPTCEKMALIVGDGWPDCRVCDRDDIDLDQVADDYVAMWDWSWKHPKHGPDDEMAWCEECGEQAVVPAGDDVKEELIGTFSIPAPQEPGEDLHLLYEPYICFACGTAVPSRFVCGCGFCGAVYVDSGEEEEDQRLCPSCGRF